MKQTIFFTADNLELKGFKGIANFKGRLNGECCLIIGSEAAGKSNYLQALFMILKQYPSAILKQGEDDGKVSVEISRGDMKYLFKFSFEEGDKEPRLKTIVDGERITMAKQADVIKQLTPKTFDLDELINAKGQVQADLILTAFDIDVSDEREAYKEAFDERKLAKRSLEEVSHFEVKEEVKEVNIKALLAEKKKYDDFNIKTRTEHEETRDEEFKEIGIFNSEQNELAGKMQESVNNLKTLRERRTELEDELKKLGERIQKGKEHIDNLPKAKKRKELISSIKAPVYKSVEEVEKKIMDTENTNEQARGYQDYLANVEKKKEKQTIVQEWDTKVKESTKAITDKINSKKLPVKGLVIKTDISESSGRVSSVLTYNDLPMDDSSINTGERIAIAAKLQMSLFKPGNLAIVTINAGSIGDSTIKSISKECEKKGMQCLFELTSRNDKKQLEIETVLKK